MKIKTKELTKFLKKFRMSGKVNIAEALFRFEEEGLKVAAFSGANLVKSMSWLKTTAFEEYEAIKNIGLNDLENVVKVLDRFGETVSLSVEGNLLTIKGSGKKVDITLVSEEFLTTDPKEPALEFEETFTIEATKLKDIFKDVKMNKDALLNIKTEEKKVIFTNTGKYKFRNVVECPTIKGGVEAQYGQPFLDALEALDGTLEISFGNGYPAKVMEKSETSIATFIIAPLEQTE